MLSARVGMLFLLVIKKDNRNSYQLKKYKYNPLRNYDKILLGDGIVCRRIKYTKWKQGSFP